MSHSLNKYLPSAYWILIRESTHFLVTVKWWRPLSKWMDCRRKWDWGDSVGFCCFSEEEFLLLFLQSSPFYLSLLKLNSFFKALLRPSFPWGFVRFTKLELIPSFTASFCPNIIRAIIAVWSVDQWIDWRLYSFNVFVTPLSAVRHIREGAEESDSVSVFSELIVHCTLLVCIGFSH